MSRDISYLRNYTTGFAGIAAKTAANIARTGSIRKPFHKNLPLQAAVMLFYQPERFVFNDHKPVKIGKLHT
jgi:hypothetical protein